MVLNYARAGLLGLAVIQLQIYLLTGRVRAEAEAHISSGLDTLVSEIASKVNTSLVATSLNYANDVNAELLKIQDSINADAFGWVQVSCRQQGTRARREANGKGYSEKCHRAQQHDRRICHQHKDERAEFLLRRIVVGRPRR